MPPQVAAFFVFSFLFALFGLVFTLLIGNTATGLAGRLARGLAFAAAAVLGAFAKIAGFNGGNMLHGFSLRLFLRLFTI